jgi:TolB-like protein/Tfp pilus assembly protein PilF
MYSILNEDPKPIASFRTEAPRELERIVKKALAKRPSERYPRLHEMLTDLRSLRHEIESQKTQQRPSKAKFAGRKPYFLYTGFAGLLVLLVGIGLYLRPKAKPEARINSIAVLPLTNLSGDPEQEYFADGMTEALITDLAQIEALKVISRTSVMRYKGTKKLLPEIAKELKVEAVVEGSALRSGERVRIIAQLIEAATDRHLWAKSYERDLGDVLALQSEVARAVAQEIKIKLTTQEQAQLTRPRRIDPEAHVAYLKGRYYWNKFAGEGFQQAIAYFQQAIDKDPSHALAYAGLADAYIQFALGGYMPAKEVMPKAKAAVTRALQIDDMLAEAHLSWGTYKMFHEWNWPDAEREFQRALELNPNSADARHFYGHYLQVMGRVEEAIVETTHAWELDPFSLAINNELGWALYLARRYDEAIVQYKKTLEIDPNFVFTVWSLAMAYAEMGRPEEAIAELKKFEAAGKGWPTFLAEFGYYYAVSGKKTKALDVLQQLQERAPREYIDPALLVNIYIGLGEKEEAFTWLEKAYEARSCMWMPWLKVEPRFDRLRSDPRFTALLQKMNLEK